MVTSGLLKKIKLEHLAIVGLIIYIITLQQCGSNGGSNSSEVDTLSRARTVTIRSRVDTVFFTIPAREVKVKVPYPVYVYDTVRIGDSLSITTYSKYESPFKDSLIDGTITTVVKGSLKECKFKYTPKFPKYIYRIDTVEIREETVLNKPTNFLFLGAEVGGNLNTFNVSPMVGLGTKKGFMYSYRYGIIDKTHNISISKKISFKK